MLVDCEQTTHTPLYPNAPDWSFLVSPRLPKSGAWEPCSESCMGDVYNPRGPYLLPLRMGNLEETRAVEGLDPMEL